MRKFLFIVAVLSIGILIGYFIEPVVTQARQWWADTFCHSCEAANKRLDETSDKTRYTDLYLER